MPQLRPMAVALVLEVDIQRSRIRQRFGGIVLVGGGEENQETGCGQPENLDENLCFLDCCLWSMNHLDHTGVSVIGCPFLFEVRTFQIYCSQFYNFYPWF